MNKHQSQGSNDLLRLRTHVGTILGSHILTKDCILVDNMVGLTWAIINDLNFIHYVPRLTYCWWNINPNYDSFLTYANSIIVFVSYRCLNLRGGGRWEDHDGQWLVNFDGVYLCKLLTWTFTPKPIVPWSGRFLWNLDGMGRGVACSATGFKDDKSTYWGGMWTWGFAWLSKIVTLHTILLLPQETPIWSQPYWCCHKD